MQAPGKYWHSCKLYLHNRPGAPRYPGVLTSYSKWPWRSIPWVGSRSACCCTMPCRRAGHVHKHRRDRRSSTHVGILPPCLHKNIQPSVCLCCAATTIAMFYQCWYIVPERPFELRLRRAATYLAPPSSAARSPLLHSHHYKNERHAEP